MDDSRQGPAPDSHLEPCCWTYGGRRESLWITEGDVSLDASAPLGHLSVVIGQPEVDLGPLADRTKDTVLPGRFTKPFVDDEDVEIFRKALDDTEDLREARPPLKRA